MGTTSFEAAWFRFQVQTYRRQYARRRAKLPIKLPFTPSGLQRPVFQIIDVDGCFRRKFSSADFIQKPDFLRWTEEAAG